MADSGLAQGWLWCGSAGVLSRAAAMLMLMLMCCSRTCRFPCSRSDADGWCGAGFFDVIAVSFDERGEEASREVCFVSLERGRCQGSSCVSLRDVTAKCVSSCELANKRLDWEADLCYGGRRVRE